MSKVICHIPVLEKEVLEKLNLRENGIYVDGTFGSGGHSKKIISRISEKGKLISFDCDQDSFARCSRDILDMKNFFFICDDFSNLKFHLVEKNINFVNGFIFDLGLSSEQLASDRGFSYRNEDNFLDMRMNKLTLTTAFDIVNCYREKDLADLIFFYGEEFFSKRIARSICRFREKEKITKVSQLTKIITSSLDSNKKKRDKHPARKVFQALRIAVNEELTKIEKTILEASEFLSDDSSLIIISYHSLEDRIVKKTFKFLCEKNEGRFICSKKPIIPSKEEIEMNNRARSAKMRVLSKLPKVEFSNKKLLK